MNRRAQLSPPNREFFRNVSDAAFSNPFGPERADLDQKIFGSSNRSDDAARDGAILKVMESVAELDREGRADFRLYFGEELEAVRNTLLFETYHRFTSDFDNLILEQISKRDTPCRVPFAADTLALLGKRGFTHEEALQYFGFFYQIRRAFYFIDQSLKGRCDSMKELKKHLWNNLFTSNIRWYGNSLWNRMEDFSTFLFGETGTGKGSAAAAIGRSGFIPFNEEENRFAESFTRNFISINLSQYPETIIESELFGHRKGSFTGAIDSHQGVFSRCTPFGSIFLDEVGEISIPVQIKLLQVLQGRSFTAVGDHKPQRFYGRVIAATNRSLDGLRAAGIFRDDFYYRLCSDIITVPPLRQRLREDPGELDLLLEFTIQRIAGKASRDLLEPVKRSLKKDPGFNYQWPGNVRELEQAIRRIILTGSYNGDTRRHATSPEDRLMHEMNAGSLNAQEILSSYCSMLYSRHNTYEKVAQITGLDRRTVKKYIDMNSLQ